MAHKMSLPLNNLIIIIMNKRLLRHLISLFLLVPLFSFGQTINVKGCVKDIHNQNISYVNIVSTQYKIGTATNDSGMFSINIDIEDTIKLTHIAFQAKKLPVKKLLETNIIILEEQNINIEDIAITSIKNYKQKELVGYRSLDRNGSFVLKPGNQLAVFINNIRKQVGFIESVSFQIKEKGKCNSMIRIRILEKDKKSFSPGRDLLKENYVIENQNLSKNNTINLSKSNIFFPIEGVFVVIEWVGIDNNCINKSYPIITANLSTKGNYLWYNYRDKDWSKASRPFKKDYYMTPNIYLTVYY